VEKKQYELCLEVLRRFHKAGILDDLILVGSWCIPFYKNYFSGVTYIDHIAIRTRGLDFLINYPSKIKREVDIPSLLKDLGFVTSFKNMEGYIKIDHPDLFIEFLVPEKGKETDKPHPIPKLGVNATALRYLNLLSDKTIREKVEDFYLTVPHPVNFALHKLLISGRRRQKAQKDQSTAIEILKALIKKSESDLIRDVFYTIHKKWQTNIIRTLEAMKEKEILAVFENKE